MCIRDSSYQNMMFLAAGQAAGKAAGSTWDDLIRTRIFAPLGMTSSVPTSKGLTNPNVTVGHGLDHDTVFIKMPVSYTHLRAHETPEHLVCRLLLEKKNFI